MARVTALLACVLLLASEGWAATPTDALRQVFARADRILTDPETDERPLDRLLAVRKLVNEAFDFRSAAALATGDHWRARTAAEQEEFTWLFSDLLERAFVSRMASHASLERGTRIRYLGESIRGDSALVHTAMARRDGGELRLAYHLVERDGSWKVRDIAIDGVSMMANYRAQLDRVLGTASFTELLTQMRAKAGAVNGTPADSTETPPLPAPAPSVAIAEVALPAPEIRVATIDPAVTEVAIGPPMVSPANGPATPPPLLTPPPPSPRRTKAYWLQIKTGETRVRVGPFSDVEEAVLKLLDLNSKGYDPHLVAERE